VKQMPPSQSLPVAHGPPYFTEFRFEKFVAGNFRNQIERAQQRNSVFGECA